MQDISQRRRSKQSEAVESRLLRTAARLLGRGEWEEAVVEYLASPDNASQPNGQRVFFYWRGDTRLGILMSCDLIEGNLYGPDSQLLASFEMHPGPKSRCGACSAWAKLGVIKGARGAKAWRVRKVRNE